MIDLDRWREAWETYTRHRFRTAVTVLSVAWGIFMLVLLLGVGVGLQRAVEWNFRDDAINSIWIYQGETSIPHQGLGIGREIRFTNRDYDALAQNVPGVEHITGRYYLWGEYTIAWGERRGAFSVRSCHPGHLHIEQTLITRGRFLDPLDIKEKRKVTVIGQKVSEFLFRGREPLGQWIDINGILYRVVGVFEDVGGEGEMRQVYIPISTAQAAYGGGEEVHQIMFTVGGASLEQSHQIAERARRLLAERHNFSPEDKRAIRIRNTMEDFQEVQTIFAMIRAFTWVVGVGTILAGIVGVSNIMLISVRERTAEIGLRKALGATPRSLVRDIVSEAVVLTALSGYLGLVAGVVLLQGLRTLMPENDYIRDPQVDLRAALSATALLVLAGALAGWFPARRAARIQPVVALRGDD